MTSDLEKLVAEVEAADKLHETMPHRNPIANSQDRERVLVHAAPRLAAACREMAKPPEGK